MRVGKVALIFLALLAAVLAKIPNPYKVLGVSQDASEEQIKAGFKKRSRKYHPDRNKTDPRAKEKFEKIVNAYELLKDPERKRMYDLTGDEDPNMQQQRQQGGGFGFPGGGFGGFGGGGINIQDLMGGFFGGGMGGGMGGGHPGGRQQRAHHHGHHGHHGHQRQQQRAGGQRRQQQQYTFSFGGGEGIRFQF